MILRPDASVRDQLIVGLARHGAQTADELRTFLHGQVSIQSVYQELRALISAGCAVKVGKQYALKLAWTSEFQDLARAMNESALRGIETFSLEPGRKQHWVMGDLQSTINLWAHLTCALARTTPQPFLLEWAPHAIYHFLNSDLEMQFQQMLRREHVSFYLIVGGKTPLDRSYEKIFRSGGTQISFASGPFENLSDEFFSVLGEYIIRVRPERAFMRALDAAFETTQHISPAQVSTLSRLLNSKVKVRLELVRNAARSASLRRTFQEFFGPLRVRA